MIALIERPGAEPLQVLEGRFGPYVTDKETNASVPRGVDPKTLTLEAANDLLEARRSAPPREGRGRGAKKAAKKTAAAPKAKAAGTKKAARKAAAPKKARKAAVTS